MANSSNFELLDKKVQKWVFKQGWNSLRDIQERSIEPILNADKDIIISASTASGKTEAAFLPACSYAVQNNNNGFSIIYISPLKALINDQFRRLESLCEILDISLTPWHGDISLSLKNKQKINPTGILLITPESLESLLLNNLSWCRKAFANLGHIIIDEFHAFIGTERGAQLQSLMHRLEFLINRNIPRIALSATLGEMNLVAKYLRPNKKLTCEIIISNTSHSDLKLQLRGYIQKSNLMEGSDTALQEITRDLYSILRTKSNLIFANSRKKTEIISSNLRELCEQDSVPNEFFPHHGSLSKELRESLENRLQNGNIPTTAVCTMTLELGIDIGSVDSIAQVTAPHSVASLRQRLGRSGRRGEAAVLRMFIIENELTPKSHLADLLRIELFQSIAIVNLLLKKWFEPSSESKYHFSTLVQQVLSVIGGYGGVRAEQLWVLLCKDGPFSKIDKSLFITFLKTLGNGDLIKQTQDGQLILGLKGEQIVGHYSFYTAFISPEEFRLEYNGHTIGQIPIENPLRENDNIIFAGKKWRIKSVDIEKKLIILDKSLGGNPPLFDGLGSMSHDIIIQEMLNVYKCKEIPIFLDKNAKKNFEEGQSFYYNLTLDKNNIISKDEKVYILTWLGDKTTFTICQLLINYGLKKIDSVGSIIELTDYTINEIYLTIQKILSEKIPTNAQLAKNIKQINMEKYDVFLSRELVELDFGEEFFDVDSAWKFLTQISIDLKKIL